jgi:hypothetical protein
VRSSKLHGIALFVGCLLPTAGCDDVTKPDPPPQAPQIEVMKRYSKSFDDGVETGLQSNDVYDIFVTYRSEVWIGNHDGVAVFDLLGDSRRIDAFNDNSGLANPKVRVVVGLEGKLYAGTWGGGIGVYDLRAKTWSRLTSADGLVNDMVADIQIDDGTLCIATNGGISIYDPAADPGEEWDSFVKLPGDATGDLLDEFVSAVEIAHTPRGKEYWYAPRWESAIEPGEENQHGITVARSAFSGSPVVRLRAVQDNTLYEDPDGALSNGAGEFMFTGVGPDAIQRRAVVMFDVAGNIPPGATIIEAGLKMYNATEATDPSRVIVYRVLSDWGEGKSKASGDESAGASATQGDATWKHTFYPTSEWTEPGGDFVSQASASTVIRGQRTYEWRREGTVADVQFWLDNPSENHGWVLDSSDSTRRWHTRESPDAYSRPELEVRHSAASVLYITRASSGLPEPNINDVLYDETTDLFWLAFSTQGLATIDVENSTWTFYTTDDGLPSNTVYSLAEVGGVIWIGTQRGLARHRGDGTFQGYGRGAGLPASRVRKVYSDHPQRLWLGFVDGGAVLVDPNSAQ